MPQFSLVFAFFVFKREIWFCWAFLVFILITRQRARALAAQQVLPDENSHESDELFSWPDPSPPQPSRYRKLFRSFRRSTNTPQTEVQQPGFVPESVIPTPSEGSEFSFCPGNNSDSDSENGDCEYENVERSSFDQGTVYEDVRNNSEGSSSDSQLDSSSSGSVSRFSLIVSKTMDDRVSHLCDAVRDMTTRSTSASKLVVNFPIFRGDESEDVHVFVGKYRRAARLNGWSEENLALGLPLYLKGHASAWFKGAIHL